MSGMVEIMIQELDRAVQFGRQLLLTQDLDPVYTMVYRSNIPQEAKARFCLAYWCFYNVGIAGEVAAAPSIENYFERLRVGLKNDKRGTERRFFWGKQAENCIDWLQERGDPAETVSWIFSTRDLPLINKRINQIPAFGPWIAWKIADMGERVLGYAVDFSDAVDYLFKDPVQGAAQIFWGDWRQPISDEELRETIAALDRAFQGMLAPPLHDRPINLQEIETVFCKYKAFRKKVYWVGKDIRDVTNKLEGYRGYAPLFRMSIPREVPR